MEEDEGQFAKWSPSIFLGWRRRKVSPKRPEMGRNGMEASERTKRGLRPGYCRRSLCFNAQSRLKGLLSPGTEERVRFSSRGEEIEMID